MLIHVAEDGKSYDLPCTQETAVDTLLASLNALTGIPPENQLLICGDVRLEAGRALGFYHLPQDDNELTGASSCTSNSGSSSSSQQGLSTQSSRRTNPPSPTVRHSSSSERSKVLLFNRGRLLPRSFPPQVEPMPVVTLTPVPADLGSSPHPFDKSSNPLMRTLPSYERQFRHDLLQAQACLDASQQRFDICMRLVQEQHTQALALGTACTNMDVTGQHICRSFEDFERGYTEQRARHTQLLRSFQEDLQLLSACALPAPLQHATGAQSLLDFVKLPRLREAFLDCQVAHDQMEARVGELRGQFEDIKGGLRAMLRGPELPWTNGSRAPPASQGNGNGEGGHGEQRFDGQKVDVETFLRSLDHLMQEGHRGVEELETGVAVLSEDLGTVRRLLQNCLASVPSNSSHQQQQQQQEQEQHSSQNQQQNLQPLDAVAALDPMCTLHSNQLLPRVRHCEQHLVVLLSTVHASKVAMTSAVHSHLQLVARLQTRVRDVRNQLHAFREAMAHQEAAFGEIAAAKGLRRSYASCLAEVLRRHAFGLAYTARAQELAEVLGHMREEEEERRHEFARQQTLLHSQMLGSSAGMPQGVLAAMGLNELPSPCEVSIQSFDSKLIQVTAADLPPSSSSSSRGGGEGVRSASELDAIPGIPSVDSLLAEYLNASQVKSRGGGRGRGVLQGGHQGYSGAGGGEDDGGGAHGDEVERLRIENTRLMAELAVARAMEASGKVGGVGEQWGEALRWKQEEVQQMAAVAEERQKTVRLYEQRMREMEAVMVEQQAKIAEQSSAAAAAAAVAVAAVASGVASGNGGRVSPPMHLGLTSGEGGEGQMAEEVAEEEGSGQNTPESQDGVPLVAPASGEEGAEGAAFGGRDASAGQGSIVMGTAGEEEREGEPLCQSQTGGQPTEAEAEAEKGYAVRQAEQGSAMSSSSSSLGPVFDRMPPLTISSGLTVSSGTEGEGTCRKVAVSACGDEGGTSAVSGSKGHVTSERGLPGGSIQEVVVKEGAKGGSGAKGVGVDRVLELEKELESAREAVGRVEEMREELGRLEGVRERLEVALREKDLQSEELRAQLSDAQVLLDHKGAMLAECQLNCAHIENKLHEAKEEARTQRCAAERRASEYASLRSSAVVTRSLLERLARCLMDPSAGQVASPNRPQPNPRTATVGILSAKDSLQALKTFSKSLLTQRPGGAQDAENEEWVRNAVHVIVGASIQMLERAAAQEAKAEELDTRLKRTTEGLVEICDKHETAKREIKERIAFTRFQVHDLAAFVQTSSGQFQALSAPSADGVPHFLSPSSLALVHLDPRQRPAAADAAPGAMSITSGQPPPPFVAPFVVGRIVHIQKSTVPAVGEGNATHETAPFTYGLSPGASYALVSVALLPST